MTRPRVRTRRLVTAILVAVVPLLWSGRPAAAQEPDPVIQVDGAVMLDFQDADLRVVVSALAEVAGLNIVYANLPARTVTLRTSTPVGPAQVRAMLESLAVANGLELVEEGGLTRLVATDPEPAPTPARPGQQGPARAAAEVDVSLWVVQLKFGSAENVASMLRALFGLGGGYGGGPLALQASLSRALEEQMRTPYQQAFGEDAPGVDREGAAPAGQTLPTGLQGPVDIIPDLVNNAILIRSTEADFETVRAAIEQLDSRPRQVLIEVLIAEVRRSRDFALGIDAVVPLEEDSSALLEIIGRSAGDFILTVLQVGNVKADIVLQALASTGNVNIVSRPVILAQNNQEARILVGDQRPFIQLFRALPTDAAVRDQVVQYRNVGTQLAIRPTINAEGYVSLTVLQEVNSATAESQFGAPVINTREVQTQLLVRDGHTAVLGGLIDQQEERTHSGIPLLKDLPLIGALFRSTRTQKVSNELFIFLTPHVLDSDAAMENARRGLIRATDRLDTIDLDPVLPVTLTPPDTLPPLEPPTPDTVPPEEGGGAWRRP